MRIINYQSSVSICQYLESRPESLLMRLMLLLPRDLGTINRFVVKLWDTGEEYLPGVENPDLLGDLGIGDLPSMLYGESTFRMVSPRKNLSSFVMQAS